MENFTPEHTSTPVEFDPFGGTEIERTVPTTEAQREVFIASKMGAEASCAYNESVSLILSGKLDRDALTESFKALVLRHEALRSTLNATGTLMVIAEQVEAALAFSDLITLSEAARLKEMEMIALADMSEPFDLLHGPLIRARLLRTGEEEHELRITAHHVVCDGWSMGILLSELSSLYNAYHRRVAPALPAAVPFSEYALATIDFAKRPEHEQVESYWTGLYKGSTPRVSLPTDRPRPKQKTYNGDRIDVELDAALVKGLRETATRNGASFVTTLLTLFELLIYKLTGDDDVVVGLPAAGQSDLGMKHLVGQCANLLALRSQIDPEVPFPAHLKRRRTAVMDAFENQKYTFGTLLNKLNVPFEPGRIPLAPVIFNIDMNMDDGVAFDGLQHRFVSNKRRFENFEVFLNATGDDRRLTLEWSYNTDLFDATSIRRWMEDLQRMITRLIAHPTASIGELLDGSDLTESMEMPPAAWIGTAVDYPRNAGIAALFDEVANARPERVALSLADERMTYGELQTRVHALCAHLVSIGVKPGEPVAICMDRCFDMIVAHLAILRAGGCYVPIDPSYPQERLTFMLEDTGTRTLITQRHLLAALPPHEAQVVLPGELDLTSATNTGPSFGGGDDAAYIMYTSGSTGRPKGVVVPHRGIIRLVRNQNFLDFGPDHVFLQLSTISFDLSTLEIWGPLLNGGIVVLQPQLKPTLAEITHTIRQQGVTTIWLTVGLFNLLVDEQLENLRGLKHILVGGDVLSVPHVKRALQVLGPGILINGYGPTENTTFTTCFPINDEDSIQGSVPIGFPLHNTTVHVLDEHLQQVPIGRKGELYTGGDGVALGYWKREDLTAERFIDDPFNTRPGSKLYKTGDMVRWLPNGRMEFIGRTDDQVKVRGFRVELGEIENALNDHPQVKDRVVVVRNDGPGGKQLVFYLVPKQAQDAEDPHARAALIAHVREHLRERMPEYMIPTGFVVLSAFPLNLNGKVDRKALPAPALDRLPAQRPYAAPCSPEEQALAGIWSTVLGVGRIGIHDNFFELGGNSLLGIQVLAQVNAAFHVEVPLLSIFEAPTLSALAEVISGAAMPARAPIVPVDKNGDLEVSFGQQRMWMSSQFGRDAYDMSLLLRITGELDRNALARALDALVERHEPLRTTFETTAAGHLVQRIHPPAQRHLPVKDAASFEEALASCQQECQRPFDLVAGPVFEPLLHRISDREHLLLLRMHHIAGDEWSIGILFRDLSALYQGQELAPLKFSYADFAAWQRNHFTEDVVMHELDYWRNQLAGAPALLELPSDRPRPPVLSTNGALRERLLPSELWHRIEALGRQHQTTPFMTLLAAFYVLLHRYTGACDISIGTPITNRDQPGSQDLVGFFLNTLVLRTDLSGTPSFTDLLDRVRKVALGAFSHQDLPFDRVVEGLAPERTLAHAPLFQVTFVHQPNEESPVAPGLTFEQIDSAWSTAKFDLTLFTAPGPDGLICTIEYNTDLFDAVTIDRMLGHFQVLLNSIVSEPARSIGALSLMPPSERLLLLNEWNGRLSPIPEEYSMGRLFLETADAYSERTALEMGDTQVSYGSLKQRVLIIAGVLERAGVEPGDLVGLCSERCPDLVAAMLAILWRSAAFVPFDPAYPKDRLDQMFKDSGVKVLMVQEDLQALLPANSAKALLLNKISDELPTTTGPLGTAGSPAYIMYTSGSTGEPKGVVVPHRAVVRLVRGQNFLPFGPDLTFLQLSNISFDASTLELWGALLNGAKLVLQPQQKPTLQEIIATIREHKVTTVWFTAGLFNLLVDEHVEGLRGLKHILTGGDVLSVPHVKRALRIVGPGVLINGYGPTENTTFTCCHAIDDELTLQVRVPIGRPIHNTSVHILDEAMHPVPIGGKGELYAGGEGVALGYWRRPELTAERFVDDPFSNTPGAKLYRTGDLVRWLPDGTIDFIGRGDGQVKVRGFRVELGEIEHAISEVREVKDRAVIARSDMPGEKQLVAYVVPTELARITEDVTAQEELINGVREHLRNVLPGHMVPTAFVILQHLPLNANGKVDKRALPLPERRSQTMEVKHVAPRNAKEKELAELWSQLLKAPGVGVHDNFFDLGGHSLIGIQLLARVQERFGKKLPLNSLFQAPTIAGFAKLLQSETGTTGMENLAVLQPSGNRIPFFCIHGDEANHHITRYLGKDQPYYAFFHQGEDGSPFKYNSVEEIASHYVSELMTVQPEGPYLLGGYSFGGIIAYEMARQLSAAGQEVPLLVMFDMYAPVDFMKITADEEKFYAPLKRVVMRWLVNRALQKGNIGPHKLRHFHIIDSYNKAIQQYHPGTYSGPITVFKAEMSEGPDDMGWSKLVSGPIEIRVLPGDHYSVITEPAVEQLVRELSASIDRAVSKHAVEAV